MKNVSNFVFFPRQKIDVDFDCYDSVPSAQSVASEKVCFIKLLLFLFSQVKNDSFFNFFDPPTLPEDEEEEVDVDTQDLLTSDFEIGHYIRERVVPRAVLFFTGEALEGRRENLSF